MSLTLGRRINEVKVDSDLGNDSYQEGDVPLPLTKRGSELRDATLTSHNSRDHLAYNTFWTLRSIYNSCHCHSPAVLAMAANSSGNEKQAC